ncbi:hypothetical protein [Nocardia vinacea]|uniref:hypothetical protein n=1 Tax=Nocardia vinacea TaxID=96468 RepID=UPI00030BE9DD
MVDDLSLRRASSPASASADAAGSSNERSPLTGYHRLNIRYDRKATHFLGFLTLAAAVTGYKKLTKAKSTT